MAAALQLTSAGTTGTPNFAEFLMEHGRFPRIGDRVPPWEYRGWLANYVMLANQQHPGIPDRWGYLWGMRESGCLWDSPIPQQHFVGAPAPDALKVLGRCIDIVESKSGAWTGFREFVEWIAWGLATSNEPPRLEPAVNEQLYRTFDLGPLLLSPHDYLGHILAERKGNGWNPHAFYPTPHCIVNLMCQMTFHDASRDGRDLRTHTVCDPCVGTGRFLLYASNYSLCLFGQDIDPLCCAITKINGALYAPWIVWPLPESITGRPLPEPHPAPLPVPVPPSGPVFRCDDRGQGLLF